MNYFLEEDIKEVIDSIGSELDFLSGKSLLLTGAGGFLGRYFFEIVRRANKSGAGIKLTNIENLAVPGNRLDIEYMERLDCDICNKDETEKLPDFDLIVHAAGIASPFYYRAKPLETLSVATTATGNLLDLAKRSHGKFVFFSSSEIYGDPNPLEIPIKESYRGNVSVMGPRACYDESKRLGETLCYIYHEYYGVNTNTIRPFNIYGPGMGQSDYRVMPNFASQIKNGKTLEIYGDGSQTRTFCYITDALIGFFKVFSFGVPGEPYNVGNPKPEVSIADLAEIFKEVSAAPVKYRVSSYPDSYPQDEPQRRCPDITKIATQLDFNPTVDLHEGVQRFLSWADIAYARD